MGYTHGTKWNNELIEQEIRKVMEALMINRMPSSNEMRKVVGNGLPMKVSRTGGFVHWATKLNLPIKNSETEMGRRFQLVARQLLINKGYDVALMSTKHPYDLLVNQSIKIDVKSAKPYHCRDNSFHTFNLEKKNPTCDIYMVFALTNTEEIERLLIIPSTHLRLTQLSIGKQSKYNQFINRWDILEKYAAFYKYLRQNIG